MDEPPIIHFMPQVSWHDPVEIVANRRGMERLQTLVAEALARPGDEVSVQAFVADGEGYFAFAKVVADGAMENAPLPYANPIANGTGTGM